MKKVKLGGIIEHTGLSLISIENIPDRPGIAGLIFQALSRIGINIEFIVHGLTQRRKNYILFAVSRSKGEEVLVTLNKIKPQIGDPELSINPEIAVVSIFGPHFRELPGIAGIFFAALDTKGISILAISTSISTCSCIIPSTRLADAILAIGEVFEVPGEVE
jgi:aspartate kinase